MKPRFSWFSLAFACMMCFTIGIAVRPAWAATADLIYALDMGKIYERAVVYVDSTSSWLTRIDYYADLLGQQDDNWFAISNLMLPGQATYTIPAPGQWVLFDELPAGNYNLYVIARGTNSATGNWYASSGGEIVTL